MAVSHRRQRTRRPRREAAWLKIASAYFPMRNFGTHGSHTARTESKIAGQAIFLAIALMGHAPWDYRLCAFVSRGIHLFMTALSRLLNSPSLTHCPSP
ncbi:hypothetical protein E2C01_088536 [Portunus trituberculatus]|uniref:Uncharacterized protein n=1 Tax=Portunus trituberculatus TaxID=210409 RepID=A0A5B7JEX0_PORTR|nr:hypothetical protein [Portunus trituberculatus]